MTVVILAAVYLFGSAVTFFLFTIFDRVDFDHYKANFHSSVLENIVHSLVWPVYLIGALCLFIYMFFAKKDGDF